MMTGETADAGVMPFHDRIRSNLKTWSWPEWIFFWGGIPLILAIIWAIPQDLKNPFFILSTAHPENFPAYLLSAYTHTDFSGHLAGNVIFYMATLALIFSFENNKQRFRVFCLSAFILVPIITSILSLKFFGNFGQAITMQGFSGIDGAFLAYAILVTMLGIVQDAFDRLDQPEYFSRRMWLRYVIVILTSIMLALIGIMGIQFGQFIQPDGSVVNGLAHFAGFITGVITFLAYDIATCKRRNFQMMLAIVVVMVAGVYAIYLGG